jgi:hypothetical protein
MALLYACIRPHFDSYQAVFGRFGIGGRVQRARMDQL